MTTQRLRLGPSLFRAFVLNPHTRPVRILPFVRNSSSLPTVMQPSFWAALIPKPLRRSSGASAKKNSRSKEWNPATFFIIAFLLIGSMAIQMIALRTDFSTFSRRADVRIDLLKEIIEKIQNGEEVDVEGLLGTGDAARENEWEEVMKQIEKENDLVKEYERKRERHRAVKSKVQPATSQPPEEGGSDGATDRTTPEKKSKAPKGFF